MIAKQLGEKIKQLRKEKGLSQEKFAWVHSQDTLEPGEICIFLYNGDVYIKEFSIDGHDKLFFSLQNLKSILSDLKASEVLNIVQAIRTCLERIVELFKWQ